MLQRLFLQKNRYLMFSIQVLNEIFFAAQFTSQFMDRTGRCVGQELLIL
jgi:hypothetical protein